MSEITEKEETELEDLKTTGEKKKQPSRLFRAFSSSRLLIAWAVVGKIGSGYLIAPVLFLLIVHVMLFVLGVIYSGDCTTKPMMPVSMVILGSDGILKSLSYLLQLIIVIQSKMKKTNAMMFLSESSILDNGLSALYVVGAFIGAAAVFGGEMTSCQTIIYEIMFYYTIISLTILGLVFLLILWKFIKPNIDDDFIDDNGNIK